MTVIESIKALDRSANLYSVPELLKQDFFKKKNSFIQFYNRSLHESYFKTFHSFYSQQRWDLQGVAVDVVSCGMEPRSVQFTQR